MRFATPHRKSTTKLARRAAGLLAAVLLAGALPASAANSDATGSAPIASTGPASAVAAKPFTGFVPGQSVEDISKRTAQSKTFRNPDGTYTAQISSDLEHYWTGTGWAEISNRLVLDTAGGYRNEANSFAAHFRPSTVQIDTPQGTIRLTPVGGTLGLPAVDAAGTTATYSDVWPGVDVQYQVGGGGVKEDIVVRGRPPTSQFSFQVQGTSLSLQADGSLATSGAFAGKWKVPTPEVLSKDGQPLAKAAPHFSVTGPTITLAVDASWLSRLDEATDFPVTLDPSIWSVGSTTGRSYERNPYDDGYITCDSIPTPCQPRVGIQDTTPGTWRPWRSTQYFPYESLYGKQILKGQVILQALQEGTTDPKVMKIYGDDVNGQFGGIWNWSNLGALIASGTASGDTFIYDEATGGPLGAYYQDLANRRLPGMAIKFLGDETSGVYTYKRFAWFQLQLTYNTPPNVPSIVGPADEWAGTSSPALVAQYTDPDHDAGNVEFEVHGIVDQLVGVSDGNNASFTPSLGYGTYAWHARAYDGNAYSAWSDWRTFTIEKDVIFTETWPGDSGPWNNSKWTATASTGAAADIQSGQGRLYVSSSDPKATATTANIGDGDIRLTYQFDSRSAQSGFRVVLDGDGGFPLTSGYRVEVQSNSSTIKLRRFSGGVNTDTKSFTYTMDTKPQRMHFMVQGGNINVKVWPVDTLEPSAWSLQYTDPAPLPAGKLQLQHNWTSGSRSVFVDDLSLTKPAARTIFCSTNGAGTEFTGSRSISTAIGAFHCSEPVRLFTSMAVYRADLGTSNYKLFGECNRTSPSTGYAIDHPMHECSFVGLSDGRYKVKFYAYANASDGNASRLIDQVGNYFTCPSGGGACYFE